MSTRKHSGKPFDERDDLEKITSQWIKISGHLDRRDWSAAVVRAATAAEIAVNFAIRREFEMQGGQLKPSFIDGLLEWGNGLSGKRDKLLLPILDGRPNYGKVKSLKSLSEKIYKKRNWIVHRGEFCDQVPAMDLIEACEKFVIGIVNLYNDGFTLPSSGFRDTKRQPSRPQVAEDA